MRDREILNLLKAKNKVGLEWLYESHGPAVYGIVSRISEDPAIAERLLVKTFLNVWRKASQVDVVKTQLLGWVLSMTISTIEEELAVGALKREALRPFPELDTELEGNAQLLSRLEEEIHNDRFVQRRVEEGDTVDDQLQYSVLALRARMQINKALLAK
jgi:DNA-directed RNA polymerase specialized sigma24 family protein